MSALEPVFSFFVTVIGKYLVVMNSMWYTQIILYMFLLALIVSVIIQIRGNK